VDQDHLLFLFLHVLRDDTMMGGGDVDIRLEVMQFSLWFGLGLLVMRIQLGAWVQIMTSRQRNEKDL
jgi:hypothetical protein